MKEADAWSKCNRKILRLNSESNWQISNPVLSSPVVCSLVLVSRLPYSLRIYQHNCVLYGNPLLLHQFVSLLLPVIVNHRSHLNDLRKEAESYCHFKFLFMILLCLVWIDFLDEIALPDPSGHIFNQQFRLIVDIQFNFRSTPPIFLMLILLILVHIDQSKEIASLRVRHQLDIL